MRINNNSGFCLYSHIPPHTGEFRGTYDPERTVALPP